VKPGVDAAVPAGAIGAGPEDEGIEDDGVEDEGIDTAWPRASGDAPADRERDALRVRDEVAVGGREGACVDGCEGDRVALVRERPVAAGEAEGSPGFAAEDALGFAAVVARGVGVPAAVEDRPAGVERAGLVVAVTDAEDFIEVTEGEPGAATRVALVEARAGRRSARHRVGHRHSSEVGAKERAHLGAFPTKCSVSREGSQALGARAARGAVEPAQFAA
jgi:hypothetical protein